MFEVGQRHEILGMNLRRNAETTIARECHVKAVRDVDERDAIDNDCSAGVNDRDLRMRSHAIAALGVLARGIWIHVRDIETGAVRRWRDVARAAACSEPFLLDAGLCIEDGYIARDAVGHEEALALAVLHYTGGLRTYRPRCGD